MVCVASQIADESGAPSAEGQQPDREPRRAYPLSRHTPIDPTRTTSQAAIATLLGTRQ